MRFKSMQFLPYTLVRQYWIRTLPKFAMMAVVRDYRFFTNDVSSDFTLVPNVFLIFETRGIQQGSVIPFRSVKAKVFLTTSFRDQLIYTVTLFASF